MELRPYQLELVDAVRVAIRPVDQGGEGLKRVCVVLPTGGGKTVIMSRMVKGAASNGATIWAIAHREELIYQISETFGFFGIHHGIIKPGVPETPAHVQVAMIQTLKNRIGRYAMPDIVIVDECHHTPSATYDYLLSLLPPSAIVIGFTATPQRLDGKGLGKHFQKLIPGPQISELIQMGYLVPPILYGPEGVDTSKLRTRAGDFAKDEAAALVNESRHIGDVIENWRKFANGLATVAFATSIEHAKALAREFNAAGIPAAHIDGGMKKDERASILRAFKNKHVLVLVSVDLISEGFDLPSIECVIEDRPTKSMAMNKQQIGRGLRTCVESGKKRAIIIDHVENWMRHGLPDEDCHWTLAGIEKKPKDEDEEPELKMRTCPDCFRVYREKVCPSCGVTDRDRNGFEVERVAGKLVLIQPKKKYVDGNEFERLQAVTTLEEFQALRDEFRLDDASARKFLISGAKSLEDLRRVERVLGYKHGWAQHRYIARHGHEAFAEAIIQLTAQKETASAS